MGRRGKLPPINLTDDERAELERLESRRIDISTVDLGTPKRFLPRSWQRVVDRLVDAKVPVRQSQFPRVDSAGNLGAARKRGFVPEKSDNSLQLFRPHGPVEAAEQVAALLSRFSDDAEPFIVVGGDALLDAQLRRFFVPTLGSSYGASDNAYAELLSLVLELSWSPTHPARVLKCGPKSYRTHAVG